MIEGQHTAAGARLQSTKRVSVVGVELIAAVMGSCVRRTNVPEKCVPVIKQQDWHADIVQHVNERNRLYRDRHQARAQGRANTVTQGSQDGAKAIVAMHYEYCREERHENYGHCSDKN